MPGRYVVVTTFSRAIEARAAAHRVESQGIPWMLEDGALVVRNEVASRRFRRVRLKVSEARYAQARELLGLECAVVPDLGRGGVCPECGALPGGWTRLLRWVRRGERFRCEACGYWWQHPKPGV